MQSPFEKGGQGDFFVNLFQDKTAAAVDSTMTLEL
jgi:hypothetical protein